MILLSILEHDLHRLKAGSDAVPLWAEEPVPSRCLPALVSSSRGAFLVSRRLTEEKRLRVGIFNQDPDRLDDLLEPILTAALELSMKESWPNVFRGQKAAQSAFDYISKSCPSPGQPHLCLYPRSWDDAAFKKFFHSERTPEFRFNKICRTVPSSVPFPVLLSRPDMVGKCTQFLGGKSSILLHNIKLGMGLCPIKK